jgi:hypothetical protein
MKNRIAILLGAFAPLSALANDAYLTIGAQQSVYDTGQTSEGRATNVSLALTSENRSGFWHGITGEVSIAASSSPGDNKNALINAEYRMGKYWYPRASASDFSLWGGLGYWTLDDAIGNAGNQERTTKALYVPLGIESGIPVIQGNTYFVYGGSLMLIFDGSVQSSMKDDSERGGTGFTGWAGFDFRHSRETLIETRFIARRLKIDGDSDFTFNQNSLSLSVRF